MLRLPGLQQRPLLVVLRIAARSLACVEFRDGMDFPCVFGTKRGPQNSAIYLENLVSQISRVDNQLNRWLGALGNLRATA